MSYRCAPDEEYALQRLRVPAAVLARTRVPAATSAAIAGSRVLYFQVDVSSNCSPNGVVETVRSRPVPVVA
jgi:hypothetical protein